MLERFCNNIIFIEISQMWLYSQIVYSNYYHIMEVIFSKTSKYTETSIAYRRPVRVSPNIMYYDIMS